MKQILSTMFILLVLTGVAIAQSSTTQICHTKALIIGRVTSINGFGISRAIVQVGAARSLTNQLGYYSLYLPNCGVFTVTASAKGAVFSEETIWLPVADTNVVEVDLSEMRGPDVKRYR